MRWKLSLVFMIGFLFAGCAPEEEAVCKHMMDVYGDKADKPLYLSEMPPCIEHMQQQKKRHGVNSYRREVECILSVNTAYKIRTCQDKENARRM